MPPLSLPALQSGKPTVWEEAIYAFLVEKRSRSGSTRTVESYSRMLWPFFRVTTPDQVRSADVLAYAHGIGASDGSHRRRRSGRGSRVSPPSTASRSGWAS
jgi:hypothetical protein